MVFSFNVDTKFFMLHNGVSALIVDNIINLWSTIMPGKTFKISNV